MQLLKDLGLYGKGLIHVSSKARVERYNQAMIEIGLDPTQLTEFHIDGWGWSPEIAEEKQSEFYLSHGLANPYAIILTPEQKGRSVIMPHHSFDKYIMKKVFEELEQQLLDLTTQSAVIMECDQAISHYRRPSDLLDIEFFTLRFSTIGNLSEAKQTQLRLEKRYYEEEFSWSDEQLRKDLRKSYKEYGVLSKRKFTLPEIAFPDVETFHTNAFGGTYVFRNVASLPKDIIAHANGNFNLEDQPSDGFKEYHLGDEELINYLKKHAVVGVYSSKLFGDVDDLERMKKMLFIQAFQKVRPDDQFADLSDGQTKKYVNQFLSSGELSEDYVEMEQLIAHLKQGRTPNIDGLSKSLYRKLLRPNPILPYHSRKVVWRMLLEINPFDVFRLYVYHKLEFFKHYTTWNQEKKTFVAHYIKDRYQRNTDYHKN